MLKKLKDNKSGFSLVELICAVLILGAVCGPLVWSFVASSNMSRTAVEISRATLAAENIIQTIDARPVTNFAQCSALDDFPQLTDAQKELLTEMFGSDQSVTLTTLTSNDGTNTKIGEDGSFQLAVQGLKTGSTEYDALVSFTRGDPNEPDPNDPDPPPGSHGIYEINSQDVAEYENMDAVFSQPFSEEANPDIRADVEIRALMAPKGISPDEEPIKKFREITVNAQVEDDSAETIKCYVQYEYTYQYAKRTGETKGQEGTATYTYYILPGEYPNKENINIYLMIYPWYSGSVATAGCDISNDYITVINNSDMSIDPDIDPIDMTVYVYMQKPYVCINKETKIDIKDDDKDGNTTEIISVPTHYEERNFGEMLYYKNNPDGTVTPMFDNTAKNNINLTYVVPEGYDIDETEDEEADIRTFIYTNCREVAEEYGTQHGYFEYGVKAGISGWTSGHEGFDKSITGDLVKKKKNKLMYDIKIDIYESGTLVIDPEDETLSNTAALKPIYSTLSSKGA